MAISSKHCSYRTYKCSYVTRGPLLDPTPGFFKRDLVMCWDDPGTVQKSTLGLAVGTFLGGMV